MHAEDLIIGLDYSGECDRCHRDDVRLYEVDPDNEEEDRGYCLQCARKEAQATIKRATRA
jgi:hypothetical protein